MGILCKTLPGSGDLVPWVRAFDFVELLPPQKILQLMRCDGSHRRFKQANAEGCIKNSTIYINMLNGPCLFKFQFESDALGRKSQKLT